MRFRGYLLGQWLRIQVGIKGKGDSVKEHRC